MALFTHWSVMRVKFIISWLTGSKTNLELEKKKSNLPIPSGVLWRVTLLHLMVDPLTYLENKQFHLALKSGRQI